MSPKVISLLADALENSTLQQKFHAATTPEIFLKIAAENGYELTKEELATALGKMHVVFGEVVQSMMSELVGEAPTTNGKSPTTEKISGTNADLVKRLFSRGEAFDTDVNPVFNPTIAVPDTASVFTVSEGKRLTPPNTMKKHFAEHPEGIKRVADGFAPKWSIDGPKWSIDKEGVNLSEQSQAVVQLSEAVIDENWEQVKAFLTEDIFYKVGSAEPVYGKQAVVDFLSSLFANTAKFTGHKVRKIWNEPGIIAVEMDALYTTVKDKRHLTIACCDIYRMRGNQVSEWRVYVDILPFYQTEPGEQQPRENADGNKQLSGVGLRK